MTVTISPATMAARGNSNNMSLAFLIIQLILVFRVYTTQIRGVSTASKYG